MSDVKHQNDPDASTSGRGPALFSSAPVQPPSRRGLAFVASAVILVIAIVAAMLGIRSRHNTATPPENAILPADPYAPSLPLSQLAMSQSTSLSGGTSTFIDGHVTNSGQNTVTGATVQAIFHNDVALPPDIETLPLMLIRTHEPYIDTEPISAAPLKPGADVEFRLVIENMPANWNQQMPEIRVVRVAKK